MTNDQTERLKELSRRPFVSPGSGDWQSDAIVRLINKLSLSNQGKILVKFSPAKVSNNKLLQRLVLMRSPYDRFRRVQVEAWKANILKCDGWISLWRSVAHKLYLEHMHFKYKTASQLHVLAQLVLHWSLSFLRCPKSEGYDHDLLPQFADMSITFDDTVKALWFSIRAHPSTRLDQQVALGEDFTGVLSCILRNSWKQFSHDFAPAYNIQLVWRIFSRDASTALSHRCRPIGQWELQPLRIIRAHLGRCDHAGHTEIVSRTEQQNLQEDFDGQSPWDASCEQKPGLD